VLTDKQQRSVRTLHVSSMAINWHTTQMAISRLNIPIKIITVLMPCGMHLKMI